MLPINRIVNEIGTYQFSNKHIEKKKYTNEKQTPKYFLFEFYKKNFISWNIKIKMFHKIILGLNIKTDLEENDQEKTKIRKLNQEFKKRFRGMVLNEIVKWLKIYEVNKQELMKKGIKNMKDFSGDITFFYIKDIINLYCDIFPTEKEKMNRIIDFQERNGLMDFIINDEIKVRILKQESDLERIIEDMKEESPQNYSTDEIFKIANYTLNKLKENKKINHIFLEVCQSIIDIIDKEENGVSVTDIKKKVHNTFSKYVPDILEIKEKLTHCNDLLQYIDHIGFIYGVKETENVESVIIKLLNINKKLDEEDFLKKIK